MSEATTTDIQEGETRTALLRLGATVTLVGALGLLGFAVPVGSEVRAGSFKLELDRVRPWAPGASMPLARLFAQWESKSLPAFAGAGSSYRTAEQIERDLGAQLGQAVASNLGAEPHDNPPAPPAPGPAVRIDPSEYEGIDVDIENREALRAFYEALRATARDEPHAITRVAHYGDSSIASDLITHTIRRRIQTRFGDAGHGFILVARGNMPYGHRDVVHRSNDAWLVRQIVVGEVRGGHYGYGGVTFQPRPGARAEFGTPRRAPVGQRVSRYEIYYRRDPEGGRLRYRVDRGERQYLDTRGPAGDAVHVITVPDGRHRLFVRPAGGRVRLYGIVMERTEPGVVYDSLGLVGARARRLLNFDAQHIAGQMGMRQPDLLVLGFGGNSADDPHTRADVYEEDYVRVIRRMRAGRAQMSCLVFAPLDQGYRDRWGRVATMATVPGIVDAQRRAASREGCAFFNTFEAMGGEGAMARWARTRPRLALSDYRHATPAGYEVIGNMFYKALLKGFAEFLEARP